MKRSSAKENSAATGPGIVSQEYEMVPVEAIESHPQNVNQGDVGAIIESIRHNRFFGAVTVQKSTSRIIAGKHRWLAARECGLKLVPVIWADVDDEAAVRMMLVDNRTTRLGLDDPAALSELLQSLPTLEGTGFDADALDELLADLGLGGGTQGLTPEDEAPEPPTEPVTVLGDLWLCCEHRVLCGDSTSVDAVERLMGGQKADMMFTDPPYGVNYEGGHFHSGDVKIKRKRDRLEADDSAAIYGEFLPVAIQYLDGPGYMWFAGTLARDVFNALHDNACTVSALLIWHKTNATYAAMNAQYKQRHEPCVYFKPKKSTLRWCGASTESTLWEEERDPRNDLHPTQKPVRLAERAIRNHEAGTVLDLFGGSGSTLIACDKTARRARLMELEPQYIDVIVTRWQEFTGKRATLDGDGRTFDEIAAERQAVTA